MKKKEEAEKLIKDGVREDQVQDYGDLYLIPQAKAQACMTKETVLQI